MFKVKKSKSLFLNNSALLFVFFTPFYMPHSYAVVISHPSQANQPHITTTQNGQQVIDINAPSSAGLSHNIYNDFNVDKQGVVLNNGLQASQSQLAGLIAANGNLSGKAATIILNEVHSVKKSELKGMIEVAGERAQVIIANPAGITCSGCGFINTERATLTTGTPQVNNGALSHFAVNGGKVLINGNGLKNDSASYTDIIANMVNVSASLKAKKLRVITGKNSVDNNTQTVTKTGQDNGWLSSKVAVDITSLGGIQAESIMIMATEEGFGVKNAGSIATTLNDLTLTAGGYLTNTGIISTAGGLSIDTNGSLDNRGILKSGATLTIATQGKAVENKGEISSKGQMTVNSGRLENRASIESSGDISFNTGKETFSNGVNIFPAKISSKGKITIAAGNLDNINNALISSEKGLKITTDKINNQRGRILTDADMQVEAKSLYNFMGGLFAKNNMSLNFDEMTLNSGGITVGNDLFLHARKVDSRMGAVQVGGKATIVATHSYINSSGVISVGALDMTTDKLANYAGLIASSGDVTIAAKEIDNRYMSLYSPTLGIWIDNIGVNGGIVSEGSLKLTTQTLNNQQGRLLSKGGIFLNTQHIDNTQGAVFAQKDIVMNVHNLNNERGSIKSDSTIFTTADKITGTAGSFQAFDDLELTVNNSFSNYHTLTAGNNMSLDINGAFNNWKKITAGQNLNIYADQMGNYLSSIYAGRDINLNIEGIDINLGWINAGNKKYKNGYEMGYF